MPGNQGEEAGRGEISARDKTQVPPIFPDFARAVKGEFPDQIIGDQRLPSRLVIDDRLKMGL
jgi:hypothetical protein